MGLGSSLSGRGGAWGIPSPLCSVPYSALTPHVSNQEVRKESGATKRTQGGNKDSSLDVEVRGGEGLALGRPHPRPRPSNCIVPVAGMSGFCSQAGLTQPREHWSDP